MKYYEITAAISGNVGTVKYDLEPGVVMESEVAPEVLAKLLKRGLAKKTGRPAVERTEA